MTTEARTTPDGLFVTMLLPNGRTIYVNRELLTGPGAVDTATICAVFELTPAQAAELAAEAGRARIV
jgi:hypothetical protein